tara:strand:+ start:240 stop:461 length:222 start_codon:yes stop_codon:yes gene_type:complete
MVVKNSENSFWDSKPYWCQPWSIIVFGILAEIFIWMIFNNILITSILGFVVIIWWILFLKLVPNSYEVFNDKK